MARTARRVRGERLPRRPIGFIIDSPVAAELVRAATSSITSPARTVWFEANRKAIETFPEVIFLPGFWSEFGMCTEPSAFGAKCVFPRNEFPFADKIIHDVAQIDDLAEPNPATDGLLPFMLNRLEGHAPAHGGDGPQDTVLRLARPAEHRDLPDGHHGVSDGPQDRPGQGAQAAAHSSRSFLKKWHALQRETFPTIDGMFLLDDIVGFIGEEDFKEFGLPYFKELYAADVAVKFFHNDAECAKSIGLYPEIGINLYNPGIFKPARSCGSCPAIASRSWATSRRATCWPKARPPTSARR